MTILKCSPIIGNGWGRPTKKLGAGPQGSVEHYWVRDTGGDVWRSACGQRTAQAVDYLSKEHQTQTPAIELYYILERSDSMQCQKCFKYYMEHGPGEFLGMRPPSIFGKIVS